MNQLLLEAGNDEGQINVLKEQIRAELRNEELTRNRDESIGRELAEKEESRLAYEQ